MTPDAQSAIDRTIGLLQIPFWHRVDFWIATTIGIAGLLFSFLAFIEARKAERAATAAGRTVKLQTVIIDLTEIAQKLGQIEPNILFSEARDLLAEISRRLHRATAPFTKDSALSSVISATIEALQTAQASLKAVRPTDPSKEAEAPSAVYNAVEENFATINNLVADLLGLLEKETLNLGENDAKT